MDLLIGTNNRGKVIEICEVLSGLPVTILTPADFSFAEAPAETGTTFAENAVQKAAFYFEKTGVPVLADDSGIEVEALRDELGLHTRRWGAGPAATDEEWIAHFLERMKREENKKARFVCTLAHIDGDGKLHIFEGTCEGTITETMEADFLPGLPISACFKPEGYDRVFSALSIEQKNSTSHRGKASRKFADHLRTKPVS
ncbi:MAG: non-canonical purine NTP pyrophosphatase [Candidatus Peribacteraceae bacterium]|nr:non-canonical purine NTP pyrophosphatase [Candidatus Peribacteraceae bacterium]